MVFKNRLIKLIEYLFFFSHIVANTTSLPLMVVLLLSVFNVPSVVCIFYTKRYLIDCLSIN